MLEMTITHVSWKVYKNGVLRPIVSYQKGDCSGDIKNLPAQWLFNNRIAPGAKITMSDKITIVTPSSEREFNRVVNNIGYCPSCGSSTQWDLPHFDLKCTNPQRCIGVAKAKTLYFFQTLDMPGLSSWFVEQVTEAGYTKIKDVLNMPIEEIIEFDGVGDNVAHKILNSINEIKRGVWLPKLMQASDCFNGIGVFKAERILAKFSKTGLFAFENGNLPWWKDEEELKKDKCYIKANPETKAFMRGILPFYEFVAKNSLRYYYNKTENK